MGEVKGAFGWDVSPEKLEDTQRQYTERTEAAMEDEPDEEPTAESGTYEGVDDELTEADEEEPDDDHTA